MTLLALLSSSSWPLTHSILTAGRHMLPGLSLTELVHVLQLASNYRRYQGEGVHDKIDTFMDTRVSGQLNSMACIRGRLAMLHGA